MNGISNEKGKRKENISVRPLQPKIQYPTHFPISSHAGSAQDVPLQLSLLETQNREDETNALIVVCLIMRPKGA
jgi:hypothetical protein